MFETVDQFNTAMRRAVYQEQLVRDAGFLGVNGRIGRHEVLPLTLYHYVALKVAGSPFLPPYTDSTAEQMVQFLWLLNPKFSPGNHEGKAEFIRSCRYFCEPKLPLFLPLIRLARWQVRANKAIINLSDLIRQAREYMDEELQDAPPGSTSNVQKADYYSGAASIVGTIAREYGWCEAIILHMPVKRTFQYLKEISEYQAAVYGTVPILFNPSDRLKNQFLVELNARLKKN